MRDGLDGAQGCERVPVFARALKGRARCPDTGLRVTESWDAAVYHFVPDLMHIYRGRGLLRSPETLEPTSCLVLRPQGVA